MLSCDQIPHGSEGPGEEDRTRRCPRDLRDLIRRDLIRRDPIRRDPIRKDLRDPSDLNNLRDLRSVSCYPRTPDYINPFPALML